MSGLIADYGIDLSNVSSPEFNEKPADDIYEFTLGDVFIQEGSKNHPEKSWVIFKYLLGDNGQEYSELFSLPQDATAPTAQEIQRLGFYKQRLVSLGVSPDAVNDVTADDLIGTRGTLELRTTLGKDKKEYQNIRNFKVAGGNEAPVAKVATAKPATAVDNPFK